MDTRPDSCTDASPGDENKHGRANNTRKAVSQSPGPTKSFTDAFAKRARVPSQILDIRGRMKSLANRLNSILAEAVEGLFVYPDAHLEMRQVARIILKSKEEPP